MSANPSRILAPLLRAVQRDKPIPAGWHEPLVELVEWLLDDPDPMTRVRACRIIIEMEGANQRAASRGARLGRTHLRERRS